MKNRFLVLAVTVWLMLFVFCFSAGAFDTVLDPSSTGCAMLDTGAASVGAGDAYAFTLSKLVPGASYTLYLYGTGDASFTIGGETKALEGQWFRTDYAPCFAQFAATADANGTVSGTFAASSATGAVFSGLTVVGDFPDYIPEAFILVVR